MGDLFLLSEHQMARLSPHFPLAHGVPWVDDRRVVGGIVYAIRNGLQWKDAPKDWSTLDAVQSFYPLESARCVRPHIRKPFAERSKPECIMIDSTHLKAHRTAASLVKKNPNPVVS
nr:transposase [Mesorhizobium composti]